MLKLSKSIKQQEKIELVLDSDLLEELELYLKVGKQNKHFSKEVEAQDIIEQLIINLTQEQEYLKLRKEYMAKLEEKRAKARAKAREKKMLEQKNNQNKKK